MALKFRKVQRKAIGGDDQGKVKTYAVAKATGYCDMEKLCIYISARCAVSSADVKAVLDSLNWLMDVELRSGNIVQLGEFGSFRLSVSSQGADSEKDFTAANIRKAKIVFSPGASLRDTKSRLHFEHDKPYEKEAECDRVHAD